MADTSGVQQPNLPFNQVGAKNQSVDNLFKSLGQNESPNSFIKRGSLLAFSYSFWMNDPYPLVIVTDVISNVRVRGVNLHYLTFPYIKNLLGNSCGQTGFSYKNVKGDQYIINAFRTYKWQGIRQIKQLDCNFLLTVMATVRSFDPNQVQAIRESVRDQLQRATNPKADQMMQQSQNVQVQNTQPTKTFAQGPINQ